MKTVYNMTFFREHRYLWTQESYNIDLILNDDGWFEGIENSESSGYMCGIFAFDMGLHFYEFSKRNFLMVGLETLYFDGQIYRNMEDMYATIEKISSNKEDLVRLYRRLEEYKATMSPYFSFYYNQMHASHQQIVQELREGNYERRLQNPNY